MKHFYVNLKHVLKGEFCINKFAYKLRKVNAIKCEKGNGMYLRMAQTLADDYSETSDPFGAFMFW